MEPEPITVRAATSDDLDALGALAGALVRFHHGLDPRRFMLVPDVEQGYRWWLEREISNPAVMLLVAANPGGDVVGYAYGREEPRDWNRLLDRHGELHDILVRDDARRHGAGRKLLDAMVAAMRARGIDRVVLQTAVANAAAQGLFHDAGFKPTMIEMTLELAGVSAHEAASSVGGTPD